MSSLIADMETNSIRICKICDKSFASGKAMGGHMRSHFLMAKLPPKPQPLLVEEEDEGQEQQQQQQPIKSSDAADMTLPAVDEDEDQQEPQKIMRSSSISDADSLGSLHGYSTEVSSKRSFRPNLVSAALNNNGDTIDLTTNQYFPLGSWTGGLRNQGLLRKRTERRPRSYSLPAISRMEVTSSRSSNISDPSPPVMTDEELALCLLELSKDTGFAAGRQIEVADEGGEEETEEEDDDDAPKRRRMDVGTDKNLSLGEGKFQCETCNKYLPSYQALGGHRAGHTRSNNSNRAQLIDIGEGSGGGGGDSVARRESFECLFCDKVFESGQALGGHKKVHFSYLGIVANNVGPSAGAGSSHSSTSGAAAIEPSTISSPPHVVVEPTAAAAAAATITTTRPDIDLNLPAPIEDGDGEVEGL